MNYFLTVFSKVVVNLLNKYLQSTYYVPDSGQPLRLTGRPQFLVHNADRPENRCHHTVRRA